MLSQHNHVPLPDLRIVPIDCVYPHEEHDFQRAKPLIEILRQAEFMTNPPIVAPIKDDEYVVLDGANRHYSLTHLGYKHILVQVARYESGLVELSVWHHIVSGWTQEAFANGVRELAGIRATAGWSVGAIAEILLKDGLVMGIHAPNNNIHEKNHALRQIVHLYQQNARLHRTAIQDPNEIWPWYPDAIALVLFPQYRPEDIISAAQSKAFLPPGVSRHIIQGRALNVNYPLAHLRDETQSLAEKNEALRLWIQKKLVNRNIRYYAEATYQFDE